MNKATLLLSCLLLLSACAPKDDTTTAAGQTQTEADKTDEATDQTKTDDKAASDETQTADQADNKADDKAATVSEPEPVPSGYDEVAALTKEPVREFKKAPAMALQDGKDYYALVDTSKGQMLFDLYEQETPITVNNFVTLARNHFFDGLRFHRVIEGFMAQTGDPLSADEKQQAAWGTGGPGYQFADEFREKLTFNGEGVLAMANSGPATNGSQFFITFGPTDFLNGRHTIFGKIVTGNAVLGKLTRTMDDQNAPISGATADQILAVRILTKNR